jgi:hypothetical protein
MGSRGIYTTSGDASSWAWTQLRLIMLTLAITRPQNNTAIIHDLSGAALVDGVVSSHRDAILILSANAMRRSAAALALTGVSHSLDRILSKCAPSWSNIVVRLWASAGVS